MNDILSNIYESSINNRIYGMGETTIDEITDYVQYKLEQIISDNELDIDIIELYVHGSRVNGNPHKDSDLDIALYYHGDITEANLYDIVHDEKYDDLLMFDHVYIDIKPIRDEETGSLEKYKEWANDYKK